MRPLTLRLTAFGSFPESEVIRFGALAELGLFVVSGPTGSGKTTVFDAMAFALYGKVPGDRPADVRSHHAAASTSTEVSLEFEVEEGRFRVWRKPAQERALQRRAGTRTVPAEATLEEWIRDHWQGVLSQPSKVTERCHELIGLDAEQFQRVVLLPQGRFAQFLLSDTGQRQALLRQLFGSSHFLVATDWYRAAAHRLAEEVAEVDEQIRHHLTNARVGVRDIVALVGAPLEQLDELPDDADDQVVESLLRTAVHVIDQRRCSHGALSRHAARLLQESATSAQQAMRFDRAVSLGVERDQLEGEREAIALQSEQLRAANRVLPVAVAADALERADRSLATAAVAEAAARQRVHDAAAAVEVPIATIATPSLAAGAFAERRAAIVFTLGLLEALDVATQLESSVRRDLERGAADIATADHLSEAAKQTLVELQGSLATVMASADSIEVATLVAVRASERLDHRRRLDSRLFEVPFAQQRADAASAHERTVLTQFIEDVAPRLAATLQAGAPCVVCGATEHPSPAIESVDVSPVEMHHVATARELTTVARDLVARLLADIAVLQEQLDVDASTPVAAMEQRNHEAAAACESARQAVAGRPAAEIAVRAQVRSVEAVEQRRQLAVLERERATARHLDAAASLQHATLAAAHLDPPRVRDAADRLGATGALVDAWAHAVDELGRHRGARAAAAGALELSLETSGFDALAAALDCAMPEAAVAAATSRVEAWNHRRAAVEAGLAEVVTFGVVAQRPDAAAARTAANTAAERVRLAAIGLAEIDQRRRDVELALAASGAQAAGSIDLRAALTTANRVAQVCAGQIGRRLTLETWVLAAELDRVTVAANVHLHRMTAGRYAVRRGEAASLGNKRTGLDLVVFDAHTGRERSPATLSGGERFQASLSLALGLADVVSQGGAASGKVFEALFVDEGFGSLDPDALDDAIVALQQLQATGRMVGIITHVEAMKQQLPTGIAVRRRDDGRGSTVADTSRFADTRSARDGVSA